MIKYEALRDVEQRISIATYNNVVANLHFHRSIEIVYVIKGSLKVKVGAKECIIEQDEMVFIPTYFAHAIDPIGETTSITFIIPYNYFNTFINQGIQLHFLKLNNLEVNKQIFNIIKLANDELENQPSILMQGYINVILGLVNKYYPKVPHEEEANNMMIEIINYIDNNYKESITLESISNHFKYSKYYFSRMFNKLFGCNLNYYVNQVRLNNVLSNLDENKKISTIIAESGFNDISTFYKLRKRMGKAK